MFYAANDYQVFIFFTNLLSENTFHHVAEWISLNGRQARF